jgi:hypothetical protein
MMQNIANISNTNFRVTSVLTKTSLALSSCTNVATLELANLDSIIKLFGIRPTSFTSTSFTSAAFTSDTELYQTNNQ